MNILLIILLFIFLILFGILLCPVTLYIEKNQKEKFKFNLSFLFFSFDNFKNKSDKKETNSNSNESKKDEKDFIKSIKFYSSFISDILEDLSSLLSHIRIKSLSLLIICAEGDAALTAISYGGVCSIVYPLLGIIENKTKTDEGAFDLNIKCDYNDKKSKYAFNSTLKSTPLILIIIGIKVFLKYQKHSKQMQ